MGTYREIMGYSVPTFLAWCNAVGDSYNRNHCAILDRKLKSMMGSQGGFMFNKYKPPFACAMMRFSPIII